MQRKTNGLFLSDITFYIKVLRYNSTSQIPFCTAPFRHKIDFWLILEYVIKSVVKSNNSTLKKEMCAMTNIGLILRRLLTPLLRRHNFKKLQRLYRKMSVFLKSNYNDFINDDKPDFSNMKPIKRFRLLQIVLNQPMKNCYHRHIGQTGNMRKQAFRAVRMQCKAKGIRRHIIRKVGNNTLGQCSSASYGNEIYCITYHATSDNKFLDEFVSMHEEMHVVQQVGCAEAYKELHERFKSMGYYIRFDILSSEEQADVVALLLMIQKYGFDVVRHIEKNNLLNCSEILSVISPSKVSKTFLLWDRIFPDAYISYNGTPAYLHISASKKVE